MGTHPCLYHLHHHLSCQSKDLPSTSSRAQSGPMNPGYGRNSTTYRMLIQSTYSLVENLASALARYCHLAGAVTESSKDNPRIDGGGLSSLPPAGGEHGKTSESVSIGPLPHFFCCEIFFDQEKEHM
uniref:Uncharacterized protein n=1 Tax=Myotis myotis TaxID=51298 RepID=A0A7J7TTV1_MYOMY|nr:hypothetical protein mMyoMyo1_008986 [Myotis myotis]